MTDEHLDRLVRGVDPVDARTVADLRGADQALLEEIMSQSPAPHLRQRRRTYVAAAFLAAAVLAVAVTVPALLSESDDQSPSAGQRPGTDGSHTDQITYSAAIIKAAEKNPRLLIDEPGWKPANVYGFADAKGMVNFAKDGRELEVNWYEADAYDSYFKDRLDVSTPEPITVAGQHGALFRYSSDDFAVMLKPDGAAFAELRTGRGWKDKAEVLAVLAKVKKVDVETWLAEMTADIVTPDKAVSVAAEMLAGMTLPPGFDKADLDKADLGKLGTNDRYQFGAGVARAYVCGWLEDWVDSDGDPATARRAVDALRTTRDWNLLDEMAKTGEFSDGVWSLADKVTVSDDPVRYQHDFQCFGVD